MHPSSQNSGAYIKNGIGLLPQAPQASTVTGPVHDRLEYGSCSLIALTGQDSGAPSARSAIFKLQHGDVDDGSDAADLSGAALAAITTEDTGVEGEFDLSSAKRYVRVACVVSFTAGTTPALQVAAGLAFGGARTRPAV